MATDYGLCRKICAILSDDRVSLPTAKRSKYHIHLAAQFQIVAGWIEGSFTAGFKNTNNGQINDSLRPAFQQRPQNCSTEPSQNRNQVQYRSKGPDFIHSYPKKELEMARLKLKLTAAARLKLGPQV